ncbi:MAG: hypothetical protein AABX88_00010, partial [Nanoarchaeota archaeon]
TWLKARKIATSDIEWYLQIGNGAMNCDISYSGKNFTISIGEDEKINSNAGDCLNLAMGNYWFEVSESCFGINISVSCDKEFWTTLAYKTPNSQVLHLSSDTQKKSAAGKTTEIVNSFCLSTGSSCDYEGTLWGALALKQVGQDTSNYLPYLSVIGEDNPKFIPESFLYLLTGNQDIAKKLLAMQKTGGYWDESDNMFYDTAVALYPYQSASNSQKTSAIAWLLDVQGTEDGCWNNGNVRDTAFLLNSLWPRGVTTIIQTTSELDCKLDGDGFCMTALKCREIEGEELDAFTSCPDSYICCDTALPEDETCEDDLKGEICNSAEECSGGDVVDASDLSAGQTCCVDGTCQKKEEEPEKSECEKENGVCRNECLDDEEESNYDCDPSTKLCCTDKEVPSPKPWGIIITLFILIILVALGIIYRDRLRIFWFEIKSRFGRDKGPTGFGGPRGPGPGFPPPPFSSNHLGRQHMPRRILPPTHNATRSPPMPRKNPGELDDVLKKLKEMGN